MMTSAQVVETSVNVTSNISSQDYTHPDDHNLPNYDMTPGFKPFTEEKIYASLESLKQRRATNNTAEVLYKFFRDELNIPDPGNIEFQRVHRLGKKLQGQSRPIVARFLRFQQRELIFRSVRELAEAADTDVKVYADFPDEIRHRRKTQ